MGFPEYWLDTLLRLSLAIAVGSIIGWERQTERKPAGLRTHMMVSLGAALFVLISIQASRAQPESDAFSRAIQGIASGIGFLGAGEIFSRSRSDSEHVKIQGLTSAAAIWVSAGLGVAAGCGLWFTSLAGALLALVILRLAKRLE